MKRLFTALTLICLVFAFVPDADAQVKFRGFTALTGGGTGALDKIPIAELTNGDIGFVATDTYFYVYKFNSTATNAESSPNYIRPDDYATAGVWVLTGLYGVTLKGGPSSTPTIEFYDSDATDGEINAKIYVDCTDADSTEGCEMYFQTQVAGSLATRLTIDATGSIVIGDNTGTVKQRNTKPTANETWSGQTLYFAQCAASMAFGTAAYIQSTGKPGLADADAAATMPAIGVVVVASTDADTPCTLLTHGVVTDTDWNWTPGATIYVADGATSGVLTATLADISDENDVVQIVGVAIHADSIFVNPSLATAVLAAP
jgi:hypothetical protein